ncbi:MAG: hypothetical protein EAZ85_02600 [Bacteroidetes bacterium]|nr:MAG: hypothetical protein EAZ85_02600 [Bacteroidota bacterium]TAG90239.1 MAG: hypothetical protein EAZ20_04815 [Bacteroidota bacterium]
MKKNLFLIFIAFFLFAMNIQAQNDNDAAAGGKEPSELIVIPEKIKEKPIEIKKEISTETKIKTKAEIKAEKKQIRQQKKAEKFLNSKIGQWYLKYLIKKAEKKRLKKELKTATPEQAKILREQSEEKIKRLSGNMRTAVIFALIGVCLILLGGVIKDAGVFYILGVVCIIIALIFLVLEFV